MSKIMLTKNFSEDEIRCKCGCKSAGIDLAFMARVQDLRDKYALPMVVASGVRCEKHNQAVGGAKGSYHVRQKDRLPMALDIKVNTAYERHLLLRLALQMFDGVGVHSQYIHIDGRAVMEPALWVY